MQVIDRRRSPIADNQSRVPGFLEEEPLIIRQIEHSVNGVALQESALNIKGRSGQIKKGPDRQNETNLAVGCLVLSSFPSKRGRNLLIGNRQIMCRAPCRRRGAPLGIAAPRRIPDDQIYIVRVCPIGRKKIAAPDIAAMGPLGWPRSVNDQLRQRPSPLLQGLNIAGRKLVEICKIQAKGGNPAGGRIGIHAERLPRRISMSSRARRSLRAVGLACLHS